MSIVFYSLSIDSASECVYIALALYVVMIFIVTIEAGYGGTVLPVSAKASTG